MFNCALNLREDREKECSILPDNDSLASKFKIAHEQPPVNSARPVMFYVSGKSISTSTEVDACSLRSVSTWFARMLASMDHNDEERSFRFSEADAAVVQMFVYWLKHRRIPEVKYGATGQDTDITNNNPDHLLRDARLNCFAQDKQIPLLQNAVMPRFCDVLQASDLRLSQLQKIVSMAPRESKVRLAVLEHALRLESKKGLKLLKGLDVRYLFGFVHDVKFAKAAYRQRMGETGSAGDYMVEIPKES